MYRQTVTLKPQTPNFPLTPLWAGQGSAALVILSNVPAGASAALILTPVNGGQPLSYPASLNAVTGDLETYIAGWALPTVGSTTYEITFTTGSGDTERTYWAGTGTFNVKAAATSADIPVAPVTPHDLYVRFPIDGKYHLLTGDRDPETGLFTFAAGQEGFDTVPEGGYAL